MNKSGLFIPSLLLGYTVLLVFVTVSYTLTYTVTHLVLFELPTCIGEVSVLV